MSDASPEAAAMDWALLAVTSHAKTAIAIRGKLQQQDYGEAMHGLGALIDALARADKRALERHLILYHAPHHDMEDAARATLPELDPDD